MSASYAAIASLKCPCVYSWFAFPNSASACANADVIKNVEAIAQIVRTTFRFCRKRVCNPPDSAQRRKSLQRAQATGLCSDCDPERFMLVDFQSTPVPRGGFPGKLLSGRCVFRCIATHRFARTNGAAGCEHQYQA